MKMRRAEKQICLTLPEPCVEISGIHVEPGRIEHGFFDGHVKLWDHWKIQIIYQGTDENGAAAAKRLEETVLWEARFLALQQADGERSPVYQTPPYCVRIAVSGGAENSSQLTLSVVAVVAFGPDGEEAADDLVGGVLKRLGLLRLTESVRN